MIEPTLANLYLVEFTEVIIQEHCNSYLINYSCPFRTWVTSFVHLVQSFTISLVSFHVISICVRSSLNVLRQVLVGLRLVLLPSPGARYVITSVVRSLGKRSICPAGIRRRVLMMSGRLLTSSYLHWSFHEMPSTAGGTRVVSGHITTRFTGICYLWCKDCPIQM